jgi:hypothetical protein
VCDFVVEVVDCGVCGDTIGVGGGWEKRIQIYHCGKSPYFFSDMVQVSSDFLQKHGTYMLVVRVSFVKIQWFRCMDVRDLRKVGI